MSTPPRSSGPTSHPGPRPTSGPGSRPTSDPGPHPTAAIRRPAPRRQVIVFAGGDRFLESHVPPLPGVATVIAADSGYGLAERFGRAVDLLVGDLDSVTDDELARARAAGTRIEQHPVAKDRTDLAIALDVAVADGPASITVVGAHGGRLDHLAGALSLLAHERYAASRIVAHLGPATVTVVRDVADIMGRAGDLVSLLPVHGAVEGVRTAGLRYQLADEPLEAGSSRGLSNELISPHAEVRVRRGALLAIVPGDPAAPRA